MALDERHPVERELGRKQFQFALDPDAEKPTVVSGHFRSSDQEPGHVEQSHV